MGLYKHIGTHKEALVFELDDVLFPKRDYLLQVYYLFAQFLEYTETVPPAKDLTDFFKTAYDYHGEADIFERAATLFAIDPKYKTQFRRLHLSAHLPVKLLLYPPILDLMLEAHHDGKQLMILAEGNPAMQLNKLRHVDWNGLDQAIKVYFQVELQAKQLDPIGYVLADNKLKLSEMVYIHAGSRPVLSFTEAVDSMGWEESGPSLTPSSRTF